MLPRSWIGGSGSSPWRGAALAVEHGECRQREAERGAELAERGAAEPLGEGRGRLGHRCCGGRWRTVVRGRVRRPRGGAAPVARCACGVASHSEPARPGSGSLARKRCACWWAIKAAEGRSWRLEDGRGTRATGIWTPWDRASSRFSGVDATFPGWDRRRCCVCSAREPAAGRGAVGTCRPEAPARRRSPCGDLPPDGPPARRRRSEVAAAR